MAGSNETNSFQGTFDGNGNTLTVSYNTSAESTAPFRFARNSVVKNLHVDGTITTSAKFAGGIVGRSSGTLNITNCRSSVAINSSVGGDGTHGGIVARLAGGGNDIMIEGCVFDGSFATTNSTINCGGFIGWPVTDIPTIKNSLMIPSSVDAGMLNNTFTRVNYEPTIDNCYYVVTANMPTNQGKQAYAYATAPANLGNLVHDYGTLKAYQNGILFNGTYYVASIDNISITVEGYGDGNDKWALIASPVDGSIAPTTVSNIFSATEYDLYRLNPSTVMWENYKEQAGNAAAGFNLVNSRGYLYATKETKTLVFSGNYKWGSEETVDLIPGFNLVGNPFTTEAWVNKPYYKMNAAGSDIEAVSEYATTAIPVCTGVVINATFADAVTFSTTAPQQQSANNNGNLQMTLTKTGARSDAFQDKAIVSFTENSQLEKFVFNENHAKLYIPQEGNDYAIASSDMTGEMPLNFRATETGRYTINFNFENVDCVMIQLIDKVENIIIDLNANDSYTFMGSPADREDRFTLVFTQVGTSSNFAYQSGTDIIVSGNGTLEVFDVVGRMVISQRINGVQRVEKPEQTGVYIFRLNGRTQRIVIH